MICDNCHDCVDVYVLIDTKISTYKSNKRSVASRVSGTNVNTILCVKCAAQVLKPLALIGSVKGALTNITI